MVGDNVNGPIVRCLSSEFGYGNNCVVTFVANLLN